MQEREEIVVGSLVVLLLLIWLGYELHDSPRFAGTFWGGILAVVGSVLMLVPAAYIAVKRIKRVRAHATKWMSMRTILAVHIYAGVIGPILVVLHTGHKFQSHLGIALTVLTLTVVVSGFIGRYLLSRLNRAMRESDALIKQLHAYHEAAGQEILAAGPDRVAELRGLTGLSSTFRRVFFRSADVAQATTSPIARAVALSDTIADVEYSRQVRVAVKRAFQAWLKLHIVISCVLYLFMGLHVWSTIHFGLRWFE